MIKKLRFVLLLLVLSGIKDVFGQAPSISYTSPHTYTTGTTIPNLLPSNKGGAVPATAYQQVSTFAGLAGVRGLVNGTGSAARFNYPVALAIDATNNIYVVDGINNVIRKITVTGVVTTYAGTGAYGANNGPALTATFVNMSGLTIDPSGNLYVSDAATELIRKITPDGTVSTFAGQFNVAGAANGQGASATFFSPTSLASDKSGNIYVVDAGNFLIRKITPDGTVSTFAGQAGIYGSANGPVATATLNPNAIALDAIGNLYFSDNSNVIRIISGGQVNTFAGNGVKASVDGPLASASFYQPGAIVFDAAGNMYVADDVTIRKIAPDGTVSMFAGMLGKSGSTDGVGALASFTGPTDFAMDGFGNIFTTDIISSTIRKIAATGYAINQPLPNGLIFNSATGAISGTPAIFSPSTTYTVTGYNTSGQGLATVAIAVTGTLSFPPIATQTYGAADFSPAVTTTGIITYSTPDSTVAFIVAGKVHIAGIGKVTIRAANSSDTISQVLTVVPAPLSIIADNKSKNYGAANPQLTVTYSGFVNGDTPSKIQPPSITASASQSSSPGIYPIIASGAVSGHYTFSYTPGTLTILGGNTTQTAPIIKYPKPPQFISGQAITPITPANTGGTVPATVYGQVSTVAGTVGVMGSTNGKGTAASFSQLQGITIDAKNNLYVSEYGNDIRKITSDGIVSTFAGSGVAGSANGRGTAASFNDPLGLAIDSTGNIYVADQQNKLIREITAGGLVSTFAGGGTAASGSRLKVGFSSPNAIARDNQGNFYISDEFYWVIDKITPDGQVSKFAGNGSSGSSNGLGTAASFNQVQGVTVDGQGNVYIADGGNFVVRKITPAGLVSTLAGNETMGVQDGIGSAASFSFFQGITADAAGNVFVGDNNEIRKITPDGAVKSIAGQPTTSNSTMPNYGYADGIGTSAKFFSPSSLVFDNVGNLYITDAGNQLIRKMVTTGYAIDKPLPAGLSFDQTTGTISGTPVAPLAPTAFYVTAYNTSGASTAPVTISVSPSANANLSTLGQSAGSLSPSFTSATTSYTDKVSNATATITLKPVSSDGTATITVNGIAVKTGTATAPIALTEGGQTVITTVVTAQDGVTTKTYTLTVTRAPSSIATLANLQPDSGTLSPSFASGTVKYTDSVANALTTITVTPTTTDANATVTVNGVAVATGTASAPFALHEGASITITLVVTSQDGAATKTYSLKVIREPSANAALSGVKLSNGTLSPAFASATTSYTASVANTVSTIAVTSITADTNATIKVNGTAVASGMASTPISLAEGAQTTITAVVTAQDGATTKTYTITVTRAPSANANLSTLGQSAGGLTPAFSPATTSYTDNVSNATKSITLKPVSSDANATIKVNGTTVASGTAISPIALAAGPNTITTVVTAQNGTTTKTYTLTVTRAAGPVDSYSPGISVTKPTETAQMVDDGLLVHQGLSPNSDGVNDFLQIDNISQYPDNKLSIMNRNGQLIYEVKGYDNSLKTFDGHSNKNGQMQLPGTYFYQLDYTVNGVTRHKTGFIILKY